VRRPGTFNRSFIDLLFEEEGGFVIVDYKTDAIDEEPSESKKECTPSRQVFMPRVKPGYKKTVKEVILLFLNGPKELSFTDIGRLIGDAEKAVEKAFDK